MHCHLLDASEVYSAMGLTERECKAGQPLINQSRGHDQNPAHTQAVPGPGI